ncbi:extracellular solute-binding protein [Micromonospora sp. M12]
MRLGRRFQRRRHQADLRRLDLRRPGRGPLLTKWLDEFNQSQTKVQVSAAAVPYPTFGQTVLTQMGSGKGPDLVRFDMPEFEAASDAGLVAPLDKVIDAGKYDLLKQPDQFMVHDGVRHGVIFEASNYAMFYNADLIPTPPTTYEQFASTAKSLTKGDVFGLAFRQTEAEEAGSGRTSSTTSTASAARGPTART